MSEWSFNDLNLILKIAELAGQKILKIYQKGSTQTSTKNDGTPLTEADIVSNEIIQTELKKNYKEIPILSEEGKEFENDKDIFWCVDPLDGTKEFIKKNGEFTVNIALIKNKEPILGVIHIPVFKESFMALKNYGAFHVTTKKVKKLSKQHHKIKKFPTFAVSRSHCNTKTNNFIKAQQAKIVKAGSSLKLTLLVQGRADAYPRFAPTSLWDIAAGHIILKETGGEIYTISGVPLTYSSTKILNPEFIAVRNHNLKYKIEKWCPRHDSNVRPSP